MAQCAMSTTTILPEQAGELKRLYLNLAVAYTRAAATLQADGFPLEGAALDRLMDEDEKVGTIIRRIREIQGR
jgi:hypothetical protein